MRRALLLMHGEKAAVLTEHDDGSFSAAYLPGYAGEPVSLTFPIKDKQQTYQEFPPYLDGLLLEGTMLSAFLQKNKIDREDHFSQLVRLGEDLVGALTVRELGPDEEVLS